MINWLVKFWNWLRDTEDDEPLTAVAAVEQAKPRIPHKQISEKIVPGRVIIVNGGTEAARLEGSIIRTLYIRPGGIETVQSPILQPIWRIRSAIFDAHGATENAEVKTVNREIVHINEWDALEVVENMIEEYARARAYDIMTPGELARAGLPLTKEALAPIIERIGLKAQRENENISAEA
jgi:hypothetical protein